MMKIILYIYYFIRSLYYRGFINTIRLLFYEKTYEKKLGIHTHSIVNLDHLTLAGNNTYENHHYQGASYDVLFKIFRKLPTGTHHHTFVDYGCGKGRAIFVAEQCGFTKLIGVDIAQELIEEANENKMNYKPINSFSSIDFVFNDATKYSITQDSCIFYFFNPFGATILNKVLENIKESVKQYPRKIYCIYLNPKYKAVFNENGFNEIYTMMSKRYTEGIIYSLE